jgi:hypothetical protein
MFARASQKMKTNHSTVRPSGAALAALRVLVAMAVTFEAQVQVCFGQQAPDSVLAVVAEAAGLPFVTAQDRPAFGIYWEVRNSLPCLGPSMPQPIILASSTIPGAWSSSTDRIEQEFSYE